MISKSLSTSEKFAKLKTDSARTLYCLLIPHTNDFGIQPGDTYTVYKVVAPLPKWMEKKIESYLADLRNVKLIHWYKVQEKKYIEIIDFDEHQAGLHKRTVSRCPDHKGRYKTDADKPEKPKDTTDKKMQKYRERHGQKATDAEKPESLAAGDMAIEEIKKKLG
jgi:hypothetical protein